MKKRGEYIWWISEWPDISGVKKINAHKFGLSNFPRQKSLFLKKNQPKNPEVWKMNHMSGLSSRPCLKTFSKIQPTYLKVEIEF